MLRIGRYVLHEQIASGGMGAVHLAQILGGAGFARLVAIKRMHPHVASEPHALAMFRDEARLSARVRDPHIVATIDVVEHEQELLLVMEYVHGATLSLLTRSAKTDEAPVPLNIAVAITLDMLSGLQAVHEATDERGQPLSIVHRDVSPQNILVGVDGMSRVLDFGIAKATGRLQTTRKGYLKGKLGYMAPEHVLHKDVGPLADQYAAAVIFWELLAGRRLFDSSTEASVLAGVLEKKILAPSSYTPENAGFDDIVMRGLSRDPTTRFSSCREMASAIRAVTAPADAEEVGRWVTALAGESLAERAKRVARIEAGLADEGAPLTAESTRTLTAPKTFESSPSISTRRKWLAPALMIGAVAAAIATLSFRPHSQTSAAPTAVSDTATTTTADPKPDDDAATTSPATLLNVDATAMTSVTTSHTASHVPIAPKGGTSHHAAKSHCDPMFTIDANGIRRVKPECL
ncbi:MAG: serine/threonine-protein kinase [Polyangiaceae bacterium]